MGTLAGLITATALVGLGVVHGVWARGIWWPIGDADRFRLTVMGPTARLPRPIESWVVAGLLVAAATLVTISTLTDEIGLLTLATSAAGVVLALRGIGGFILSTFIQRDGPFAHWDRRLYSPLCLALAAGVTTAVI